MLNKKVRIGEQIELNFYLDDFHRNDAFKE